MGHDIVRLAERAKTGSEHLTRDVKAARYDDLATRMTELFSEDDTLTLDQRLMLSELIGNLRSRANRIRSLGQFQSLTGGAV